MSRQLIEDLVSLATRYGPQFEWIQGSGGNCSVKDEAKQTMYIKASGCLLSDMSLSSGFVALANEPVRRSLEEKRWLQLDLRDQSAENSINAIIDASTVEICTGFKTASIETGMHAVLGRFVFHAHHLYSNLLLCSKDSEQLLLECDLPDPICLVHSVPPGLHLGIAVLNAVQSYEETFGFPPKLINLKNHGIVFQADTLEELLESMELNHALIRARVLRLLGEDYFKAAGGIEKNTAMATSDIFPDTVVFRQFLGEVFSGAMPSVKSSGIKEIFRVAAILEKGIRQCGLQAEVLPAEVKAYILEMDREKHRQRVGAQSQ